jgi:phosphate starvation-inducible protein PhoH and related proteins
MARKIPAKRATRPNPRQNRNHQPRSYSSERDHNVIPIRRVNIFPKSLAQENYIDALEDDRIAIVAAVGPAGTGKTYIATMFAIKSLIEGRFKKIIITRPTVSTGEDIGFLPGDLYAKLSPWSVPILDIFKEIYPASVLEKMIKNEVVEIAPLGMMRGRTLKNAIILVDEGQNATPSQIKMCLTRIGENSKIVMSGDLHQHDRGFEINGLKDFTEKLKRKCSDRMILCEFSIMDIERHPVIEEVLRIYNED